MNDTPRALLFAAFCGDLFIVNFLLEKGDDPNVADADGWTPLMFAAVKARAEIVKVLLTAKAKPHVEHSNGFTALGWAKAALAKAETQKKKAAYQEVIRLLEEAMAK